MHVDAGGLSVCEREVCMRVRVRVRVPVRVYVYVCVCGGGGGSHTRITETYCARIQPLPPLAHYTCTAYRR